MINFTTTACLFRSTLFNLPFQKCLRKFTPENIFGTVTRLLGHVPNHHLALARRFDTLFIAIGAFFSPLICQSLMSHGVPWRNFYLGSLVLSVLNLMFISFAYHPTLAEFSYDRIHASRAAAYAASHVDLPSPTVSQNSSRKSTTVHHRSSEFGQLSDE
jgi:hypothetical protein